MQVNGFEVHDPEEAILLFLEQDQDITLTVARKIKVCSWIKCCAGVREHQSKVLGV